MVAGATLSRIRGGQDLKVRAVDETGACTHVFPPAIRLTLKRGLFFYGRVRCRGAPRW
ncbi:MAG: hypothetical protein ACLUEK_10915 [Oscillospiraceae bacterium]